jgi:hypothetical protein
MEFNHHEFWESFHAQEAAEKKKQDAIDNILINAFPQPVLACFMMTGVAPTGRPELPPALREVTPQFLSYIIAYTYQPFMDVICFNF